MTKRILLFEDDFESMLPFKEHIEDELDCTVDLTAERRILERLRHERFDLVIIDLMIHPASPDGDEGVVENVAFEGVNWQQTGVEFLQRLRRGEFSDTSGTLPDVPVLILSAVANFSVEDAVEGEAYLEKPFRLEEIVARVRQLLGENQP